MKFILSLILILAVIFFFIPSIIAGVIRFIISMLGGGGSSSSGRNNRNSNTNESYTRFNRNETTTPDGTKKKVFDKNEGEYVSFEEIKKNPDEESK